MIQQEKRRELVVNIVAILFIILFAYAAAMKLLDQEEFIVQLSKSPMLAPYKEVVSWIVPLVEIIICVLLITEKTKRIGLYAAFGLMTIFSFYIIAILGFSEYIPCSCGGILEKLSWKEHLAFNGVFWILGLIALNFNKQVPNRRMIFTAAGITTSSGAIVAVLFITSYHDKDKYSSFDAKQLLAQADNQGFVDLAVNSYYFAGKGKDSVYLGNSTIPHILTSFNTTSLKKQTRRFVTAEMLSKNFRLSILEDNFFLADGTSSRILQGNLKDLTAIQSPLPHSNFDLYVPLTPFSAAVRMMDNDGNFSLASCSLDSGLQVKPNTLIWQIDGKFCVDGMLLFNQELKRVVYVYFYRNQFMSMDTTLNNLLLRLTIDSVTTAKIKLSSTNQTGTIVTTIIPELQVNSHAFSFDKYLFVHSNLRARNEKEKEFQSGSRIDSYDLIQGDYLGSFPLPLPNARDFIMINKNLYVLAGNHLIHYDLSNVLEEIELNYKRNFTGR